MNVLDNFKHEETFKLMDMSDKIAATGYVIILGIGITFVALMFIWVITVIMSKTIQKIEKKNEPVIMTSKTPVVEKSVATINDADVVDEELVAVITAAIAASLNTTMHHIRVTNIKRVVDQTPTWGKMGRNDVMNARMN